MSVEQALVRPYVLAVEDRAARLRAAVREALRFRRPRDADAAEAG